MIDLSKQVNHETTGIDFFEKKLFDRQKDKKDFYTRITQFSDISWVCVPGFDRGSEKGWYILSADISPHFFIGGERMPFAISLTPRYKVRIFRNNEKFKDSSLPVRTPSFMPGLTVYIPLQKTAPNVYKDIDYLTVAAFHHSNGQDGETFESPMNFNFSNGNFSTNYVEVAFNRNWRNKKPKKDIVFNCDPDPGDCNQCPALFPVGYYDHVFKGGIEQHFGTAFDQRGSYNRTRLNLKYMFINVRNWRWLVGEGKVKKQVGRCYLRERDRVILNASINLDKLTDPYNQFKKRINFEAGFYKRIAAGNTALFIMGGYYGNDPYNIYYSKHYWFLRAGLSLGFFVHTSKIGE